VGNKSANRIRRMSSLLEITTTSPTENRQSRLQIDNSSRTSRSTGRNSITEAMSRLTPSTSFPYSRTRSHPVAPSPFYDPARELHRSTSKSHHHRDFDNHTCLSCRDSSSRHQLQRIA